jgi:hypothetical protein
VKYTFGSLAVCILAQIHDFAPPPHDGFALSISIYRTIYTRYGILNQGKKQDAEKEYSGFSNPDGENQTGWQVDLPACDK